LNLVNLESRLANMFVMTKEEQITTTINIIQDMLNHMGLEATVDYEVSLTKGNVFNINIPNPYVLIGREGQTLHALEVVVRQLAIKATGSEPFFFTIDVDDYKRKREWHLKETAKEAVDYVKRTSHEARLEPMPNYERRLVHAYIQEHFPGYSSESTGFGVSRRVVIKKKT
jgi:spoIIIJ-associated protein